MRLNRWPLISLCVVLLVAMLPASRKTAAQADGTATIQIISLIHTYESGSRRQIFSLAGRKISTVSYGGADPALLSVPASGDELNFGLDGTDLPAVKLDAGSHYVFFVGSDEMPLIVVNETAEQAKLGPLDLNKFVPVLILNQLLSNSNEKPFVYTVTLNGKPVAQKVASNGYTYFYAPIDAAKISLQLKGTASGSASTSIPLATLYPRTQLIEVLECSRGCSMERYIALGTVYDWLAAQTDPLLSFKTFVKAALSVKLDQYKPVKGGVYTLFVPTDKAFNTLPAFSKISADTAQLENLLKYHLVDGEINIDLLSPKFFVDSNPIILTTANGQSLTITPNLQIFGNETGRGEALDDITVNNNVSLLDRQHRDQLYTVQTTDGTTLNFVDTVLTPPSP